MKELIKRSYKALQKRGKIIPYKTSKKEFQVKLCEEFSELCREFCKSPDEIQAMSTGEAKELIQLITVGIMYFEHLGYNFEKEFINEIEQNEKRAEKIKTL